MLQVSKSRSRYIKIESEGRFGSHLLITTNGEKMAGVKEAAAFLFLPEA